MYAKLVLRNAKRSAKDYLIYIVTMTLCVTLFYAFLSISSGYYRPDIGIEYDLTMLSDGMKLAVCAMTLLLLFLVRYVNAYMLRRRQREFAVQAVIGMEQRTVAWLFFAETFVIGGFSVVFGILLGTVCSQFITAMLLSSFGRPFRLSWMLFPDTVLLTVVFFLVSFLAVGWGNVRTIRKIKIIDMLNADKVNEESFRKSRWMPILIILYEAALLIMMYVGTAKIQDYYDARFPAAVRVMFWGNIAAPAVSVLISVYWLAKGRKRELDRLVTALVVLGIVNACFAASVPGLRSKYWLAFGGETINQYLMFLLGDLIFVICGICYRISGLLTAWKEKEARRKYSGENLFFFGQIISKLRTTTKTMALICLTLVLAIVGFMMVPALIGWASGYLEIRSMYDVQISSRYNQVYEEKDLAVGGYEFVTSFLEERGIERTNDWTFQLYLPEKTDFHRRYKYDFPSVAIALSDYNALRSMCGYEPVLLEDGEFTTQWQSIAANDAREAFLREHETVDTDAGTLRIAGDAMHDEALGETIYNTYTDVLYVFPDEVCEKLLPVMKNRFILTKEKLAYETAAELEKAFAEVYPEKEEGMSYAIRTRTMQVNSTKASSFILQAGMTYGAVVLMVICFTVLSLQQLWDAGYYRYRFGVLRKLGVEEKRISRLIGRQLTVWFALPVGLAGIVSAILVIYCFQMISAEIAAYVGIGVLGRQIAGIGGVLGLLTGCYFACTWILFRKGVAE